MAPLRKLLLLLLCALAAVGIAVARGKKTEEAPPAPPAPTEAEVAPSPAPSAPALFAEGLPVVLSTVPPGLPSLSAQGCNGCHYAAHDTWIGSQHAIAWKDPVYQAALRSAGGSTACLGCHLPLTNQHAELAAGYVDGDLSRPRLAPNPSYDATLQSEGVTCVACHLRGDTILGTRESPNAPHAVVVSAELTQPELCATCHQLSWPEGDRPYYDTYGEWSASSYAAAKVTCQMCHMAPTTGISVPGSDGTLPAHTFSADVRRALSALIRLPSPVVRRGQPLAVHLTLQNTGAGHSVPTGNPFKKYRVEVALLDSARKDLAPPQSLTLARTVETTPPYRTTADHRLAAGASMEADFSFNPSAKGALGAGSLVVRVVHNEQVTVLSEVGIEVR